MTSRPATRSRLGVTKLPHGNCPRANAWNRSTFGPSVAGRAPWRARSLRDIRTPANDRIRARARRLGVRGYRVAEGGGRHAGRHPRRLLHVAVAGLTIIVWELNRAPGPCAVWICHLHLLERFGDLFAPPTVLVVAGVATGTLGRCRGDAPERWLPLRRHPPPTCRRMRSPSSSLPRRLYRLGGGLRDGPSARLERSPARPAEHDALDRPRLHV